MIEIPPDVRVSVVVAHATASIARQCGCEVFAAFDLLCVEASALGQTLEYTALDVLDGVIQFDPMEVGQAD